MHPWEQHMHIIKETIEKKVIVNDGGVEKQLADHADVIVAKQQTIQDLRTRVGEYKGEHDQIQKAAAQFSDFLSREAIALYNDKTQAYIEFLINEEEAKVHAGKSNKKLCDLQEDLRNYKEEVAILKKNVGTNANFPALTTRDIDLLVQRLYQLKHFGKNLEALKKKNVKIYEAQNREINHRVRGNTSWGWNTVSDIWGAAMSSMVPNQVAALASHSVTKTYKTLQNGPPPYRGFRRNPISPVQQQYRGDPRDASGHSSQQYQQGSFMDLHPQTPENSPTSSFPSSSFDHHPGHSKSTSTSSRTVMGIPFPGFRKWGKKNEQK
jgi:hypothetical protein